MCCVGNEDEHLHSGITTFKRTGRSVTDILFLAIFILAFAFSIFLTISASRHSGSAYAATHGRNFAGDSCGMGQYKGQKFAAWPIIPIIDASTTPEQAQELYNIKICVSSCDETNKPRQDIKVPYESVELWRFCIPKSIVDSAKDSAAAQLPNVISNSNTFSRYISDLIECWKLILVSMVATLVIGFVYAKLMSFKCVRTIMVWLVILAILVMSSLVTVFLFHWAKNAENIPLDTIDRQKAAKICAWIMVGVTVTIFLVILILRKRINFTLSVIGSTSCALSQMKSVFLYPVIPTLFTLGYIVYSVVSFATILTVNNKVAHDLPAKILEIPYFKALEHKTYAELKFNTEWNLAVIYQFWHLLFMNQFFIYAGYMTIAGVLGQWYFSEPKVGNDREKQHGPSGIPTFPVFSAILRTAIFHTGTIALAAMIVSVFQFLRAVITYFQTKLKGRQNRFARCVLSCINCCLYCIQKCVDYVSRNALIVSAIKGSNFCVSGCTAFGLLSSNLLRAAAFNVLSGFVLWIGKLFISFLTTGGAALFIYKYYQGTRADDLSSPVLPLVLIFGLSWNIAAMFMNVYSVSLDCMFICYLADKGGHYTPAKIKKTFQKVEEREKLLQDQQGGQSEDYYDNNGGYSTNTREFGSYKNPSQPSYYASAQQPKDLSNPYGR